MVKVPPRKLSGERTTINRRNPLRIKSGDGAHKWCAVFVHLIQSKLKVMALYRASGTPNLQMLPGAASTVLTANALVTVTAGALALVSSTGNYGMGLCMETRATTDGDYATARDVLVDMIKDDDIIFCDNVTGTLTAAMRGQFFKMSSTAGVVIDAGTATDTPAAALIWVLVQYVSATQGYFVLSGRKTSRPAA